MSKKNMVKCAWHCAFLIALVIGLFCACTDYGINDIKNSKNVLYEGDDNAVQDEPVIDDGDGTTVAPVPPPAHATPPAPPAPVSPPAHATPPAPPAPAPVARPAPLAPAPPHGPVPPTPPIPEDPSEDIPTEEDPTEEPIAC